MWIDEIVERSDGAERPRDALWPAKKLRPDGWQINGMPTTDTAMGQLLNRVGFPLPFYEQTLASKKSLKYAKKLLHALLVERGGDFLLRSREGQVIAVLTEQYARLDNLDIFNALRSCDIEPIHTTLYQSLYAFRLGVMIRRATIRGEEVLTGVFIENSETGHRSACLRIGAFHRGNIVLTKTKPLGRLYHSGGVADKDGALRIQPERVKALMRPLTKPDELKKQFIDIEMAVQVLADEPLADGEAVLRSIGTKAGLTDRETVEAANTAPESAWQAVQAVSGLVDLFPARQAVIEEVAGDLMCLGTNHWRRLDELAKQRKENEEIAAR